MDIASRILVGLWMLLLLFTLGLVIRIALASANTSASVTASTEAAEFLATDNGEILWDVGNFDLLRCTGPGGILQAVTLGQYARISIEPNVFVQITKREGASDLHITLTRPSVAESTRSRVPTNTGPCATPSHIWLDTGDHIQTELYGSHVTLTYRRANLFRTDEAAGARVLPFRGIITVGRYPSAGKQEILLSGEVSLHAALASTSSQWLQHPTANTSLSSLPPPPTYIAETLTLQRGDVLPPLEQSNHPAESSGYVRVPPRDPLQVGYNVVTDRVTVHRPGNATVVLRLSIWNRLKNEPALLSSLAVLALVWGLAQLEPTLRRAFRFTFSAKSAHPEEWS
jgi:hypothetical protein